MKRVSVHHHSVQTGEARPDRSWHSVLTHTHMLQGELDAGPNIKNLVDWANKRGVDAMGVGSPFVPNTRALYALYEEAERDEYYSPGFDPAPLKHETEVRDLIDQLNRAGEGHTLYYLDNETPKARYGHMWWVGWWHDFPEWHDYDQPFDRWMCNEQEAKDHGPEPVPYERRPYTEIVASQRSRGAMGMWAHPTSWWTTDKGAFVTNIASEMPAHLVADGFIDGLVIMGYDAYRPSYLALWRHLLDLDYEVLGVAETDIGLSSEKLWDIDPLFLTWVTNKGPLKRMEDVAEGLRSGNVYASSGPSLILSVDGRPMGSRITTAPGQRHLVTISANMPNGAKQLGRLELLTNGGKVLWHADHIPCGTYTLEIETENESAYIQAQLWGTGDLPEDHPANQIRNFAVTNPVYLRYASHRPPAPLQAETIIKTPATSPFSGGRISFQKPDGTVIEEGLLSGGDSIKVSLPANGRIEVTGSNGAFERRYLINDNPKVTALQRYLYRGQFLKDYADIPNGDVPCEAFNIQGFRDAMARVDLEF